MKYDFYITGTIGEQFDWWTGQPGTTSAQVKNFLKENKDKEVTIAVSSPGGYIDEGITIAELIADHGKCNMVIIGMTASAATILCMKAKSVKIARGSLMLIHNSSQYIYGNGFSNKKKIDAFIASLQKTRSELDTIDKALADFYSYRNGKSIEDNCAMMDQEKWMTAQEAVDFGIVDAILEDDDSNTQAKAINNVYAGYNGIEEHFGLPTLPTFDKPEPKVPKGIMAKLKNIFNDFRGVVEESAEEDHSLSTNNHKSMKKLVLNLVCALLSVENFVMGEDGTTTLTEEQLNSIEGALKEKDDMIASLQDEKKTLVTEKENLETAKKSAEDAKADAEDKLAKLQKEFDDFKAEAGDDTKSKVNEEGNTSIMTAKEMYNDIKGLL